jgi:hypothetical protein
MDINFFNELAAQARGLAATLREAEHKLAVVAAELAQHEHEAQATGLATEGEARTTAPGGSW